MAKNNKENETPEVAVVPQTAPKKSPETVIEEDAQRRKAQGLPYEMARKVAVAQAAKIKAGPAFKAPKKGGK